MLLLTMASLILQIRAPLSVYFLLLIAPYGCQSLIVSPSTLSSDLSLENPSPSPSPPPPPGVVLNICVPLKQSFTEFVSWSGTVKEPKLDGFSLQVFELAIQRVNDAKRLPYELTYQYVPVGDGKSTPIYDDEIIEKIRSKECDGAVGDLTITFERMQKVAFTQPYLQSGGLGVVVPIAKRSAYLHLFHPFDLHLWVCIALMLLLATPIALLIVGEFEDDTLPRRLKKAFKWTFLSLPFYDRTEIQSIPGQLITSGQFIVLGILSGLYFTNFSLAPQGIYLEIQGFDSLLNSNVPVGYHIGSFTKDYLIGLGFEKDRLQPLASKEEFATSLKNGSVAAIVDELPYLETLLASEWTHFTIVDNELPYFGGFGFAFQKNSPYVEEISLAILSVAKTGTLHRALPKVGGDYWKETHQCSSTNAAASDRLTFNKVQELFVGLAILYSICILWHIVRGTRCDTLVTGLNCDHVYHELKGSEISGNIDNSQLMNSLDLIRNAYSNFSSEDEM